MGDINQRIFVEKHARHLQGPYLEIGSKNYGTTQDLRRLFVNSETYIGVDMEEGPGVDITLDLTTDFETIDTKLNHMRFGTIFCLSVLEHCAQPFTAAQNLTTLLQPGGKLCLSVPFAWQYHGYPSDYWRFTHEGIKKLFPQLTFDPEYSITATSRENEFKTLDQQIAKIPFSSKSHWKSGHPVRGLSAKLLKLLSRVGIWRWLSGYRYVMAPTTILMIGTLKDE